jgi:hypothetical protein
MTMNEAIRTCRKPNKDDRIRMASHLVEALAWMHALSYAHTNLNLDHVFAIHSYPYLIRVPFPHDAHLGGVGYATFGSQAMFAKDIDDLAYLIACIFYWQKIETRHLTEWVDTYLSRHEMSRDLMRLLTSRKTFASAVDLFRAWQLVAVQYNK